MALITGTITAQDTICGKIYGDKAVAKYVKVSNNLTKFTTYSDNKGQFCTKASLGDSIVFTSLFFEKKVVVLNDTHFGETLVIQLKDKVNELDQIVLKNDEFDPEVYNTEFSMLIQNDIEKNPHEYSACPSPSGGINLMGFINLAKKILSKKDAKLKRPNNVENKSYRIISHNDLQNLYNEANFFNDSFITKDLKIPKASKSLFFDFFESQRVSLDLLNPEKQFLLCDKLIQESHNFLERNP